MIVETTHEDYTSLCLNRAPGTYRLADSPIAPAQVLELLASIAAEVRQTFSPASWLIIEDNEIVGLCSIKRPPEDGVIDIGYGIAPSRQNRGVARKAVGDIVAWARAAPQVTAITAETTPSNVASQRVLEHNGFVRTGERMDDEDGLVICWHCAVG
ncbi:MAG: GNAT family N-acetyltransferase [Oceanicaulis sp.]|uniref:GNAT family N-acetyltransferase n=1 Tax=Glycocaulis sp. TaxID=1969725 RepID=UPI0025C32F52|nr:GNAT family N-acetyltransferase [Glycocaulis sp.]MCC5980110.1 GNAT family N-acetyltransferase [Oceanicaulis sp.]MCH8521448.1 GNAT family N-acetyltransferase [Glycocaulis sp.]